MEILRNFVEAFVFRIVVFSIVFRSWWRQSADLSHNTNLGDIRIAVGNKMCQEFFGQAAINGGPNISPCKQDMFYERPPNKPRKYGHRRVRYHWRP